MTATPIKI